MTLKFGDRFVNPWAGDRNPHKVGYFVRWIYRKGRMNPGKHMQLTDKKGDFWEMPADSDEKYAKRFGDAALTKEKQFRSQTDKNKIPTRHDVRGIFAKEPATEKRSD